MDQYEVPVHMRDSLQAALAFMKKDQEDLDRNPLNWDNVNSIFDLFEGVSTYKAGESLSVKIEWESLLGRCIRKNKLSLGLVEKPEDGFLSVTKQDAQNLVGRLCDAKLNEGVKKQFVAFQTLCS